MEEGVAPFWQRCEARFSAELDTLWPPIGRCPIPALVPRHTEGEPEDRVHGALQATVHGVTMADLLRETALPWDEVYLLIALGVRQRCVIAREEAARWHQGQKVWGVMKYWLG